MIRLFQDSILSTCSLKAITSLIISIKIDTLKIWESNLNFYHKELLKQFMGLYGNLNKTIFNDFNNICNSIIFPFSLINKILCKRLYLLVFKWIIYKFLLQTNLRIKVNVAIL